MVGVFRRSLSFPNKINPNRPSKPTLSHHVRSISLPCRSHPLISQLKDEINELKSWESKTAPTSAWLCDGLTRLKTVHDSLDDLLQLPQTQESLRRFPDLVEKLLDDFLRFVDVYGIFQTSVLSLKEAQLAAQFGVRRRDQSKVAPYLKSLKKIAKEMNKLVSTVQAIEKSWALASVIVLRGDEELAAVIKSVHEVTVMVSIALFNGVSSSTSRKSSWAGLKMLKKTKREKVEEGIQEFKQVEIFNLLMSNLNKKGDEEVKMILKRMQDLEACIGCIETGSDKVFRSLINTRVSLLNVLTL